MKRVRCKKTLGVWYYTKVDPNDCNELDAPIYILYTENAAFVANFGSYGDMLYYIENGVILA